MTNKEVGEMIRTRRMARGMTQDELANAIGVTASAIGLFENGKRRPKDEVAEAIADVFKRPEVRILSPRPKKSRKHSVFGTFAMSAILPKIA